MLSISPWKLPPCSVYPHENYESCTTFNNEFEYKIGKYSIYLSWMTDIKQKTEMCLSPAQPTVVQLTRMVGSHIQCPTKILKWTIHTAY